MEILILSVISLFGRQWSQWEILTISLGVLFVLVWMTKQQRSKKIRSKYNKNQFVDSSPLIGLKFGAHKKSTHIVNNFKKDRLAPVHKHQNKQNIQTNEPLEEPHEEHKQLQKETTKHKQVKVSSEQQVSELTADNEKLQREPARFEQAESQNKQHIQTLEKLHEEIIQLQNEITEYQQAKVSFEQQVSELTADNEKLQSSLARFEQAEQQISEMTDAYRQLQPEGSLVEQISEQQVVAEPAVEVPVKRKTAKRSKTSKQQYRTVDGVRQKLCRKCKEWKPESEFHKNSSSKDGLAGSCKICKNNEAKKQRRRRQTVQK